MTLVYIAVSLYALWILYLAVMCLKRAKDAGRLPREGRIFGAPLLIFGLLLNAFINATLLSIVFLELPKWREGEWTFSERVGRHCKYSTGYRKRVGCYLCKRWLDPYEEGGHC